MGALKREYLPDYTYSDYKEWEGKWELIYGIPYAMTPSPVISNRIAWQLEEALKDCDRCQALLPIDWKIDNSTVVQPDNLVICHKPHNEAYINKAPVIIFEILSKSTATKDIHLKYELYEQEGVKYYIIVNPNDEIAKVYRLQNGRYIKMSDTYEDSVKFELEECSFIFDFSKIWV